MKTVSKLSLMLALLSLASCNEKVSPELQSGNSSDGSTSTTAGSGSGGPTITPTEYFFKITNTSPLLLNYKLHKTGVGNASTPCEVRSTSKLSNDAFRGAPSIYDITCYWDAEELSLHHGGISFDIESSPNTCDFIGYSPFGYFDQIPGSSSGSYLQASCTNDTTNSSHIDAAATALGLDISYDNGTKKIGCNEWVNTNNTNPSSDPKVAFIPTASRMAFSPENDAELCRYTYENKNCDIGSINVANLEVTYTPPGDDPVQQPAIFKYEIKNRVVKCGGAIANCVEGPQKKMSANAVKSIEYTQAEFDKPMKVSYSYESLTGKYYSNLKYSNFRRNLASSQIDYGSSSGLSGSYKSAFADPAFSKVFDPRVVDSYAANKTPGGSVLINDATWSYWTSINNMWLARPYAADPFLGMSARVNPFYTMYCYDTALDMKARVRMVVRDWDRVFPTNSDMELISDIYKGSSARQDIPGFDELPQDEDPTIPFNDLYDWDDYVSMDRTVGSYDPAFSIWSPTPSTYFTDGWFNPNNFPTDDKIDQ